MFRFTIRDVLWLMVVVGIGCGWWVEHCRLVPTIAALKAKASQDTLQIEFERAKRLRRMYETAKCVPLKPVEVDDIIDTVLHDSSHARVWEAMIIVPFISDRQYATSFLLKILNSRFKWSEGSPAPLQAVSGLVDMDAFEAISAIEEFLHFLENEPVENDEEQQVFIRAVKKQLDRLKSRKEMLG